MNLIFFLEDIWLHIRSIGIWTDKLHEFYSKYKTVSTKSSDSSTKSSPEKGN